LKAITAEAELVEIRACLKARDEELYEVGELADKLREALVKIIECWTLSGSHECKHQMYKLACAALDDRLIAP
jgi:hypothetical protein